MEVFFQVALFNVIIATAQELQNVAHAMEKDTCKKLLYLCIRHDRTGDLNNYLEIILAQRSRIKMATRLFFPLHSSGCCAKK